MAKNRIQEAIAILTEGAADARHDACSGTTDFVERVPYVVPALATLLGGKRLEGHVADALPTTRIATLTMSDGSRILLAHLPAEKEAAK